MIFLIFYSWKSAENSPNRSRFFFFFFWWYILLSELKRICSRCFLQSVQKAIINGTCEQSKVEKVLIFSPLKRHKSNILLRYKDKKGRANYPNSNTPVPHVSVFLLFVLARTRKLRMRMKEGSCQAVSNFCVSCHIGRKKKKRKPGRKFQQMRMHSQ